MPIAERVGENGSRIRDIILDRIRKTETLPRVALDFAANAREMALAGCDLPVPVPPASPTLAE